MPADSVRCGRISYTNDLPVYAAFDVDALPFPGTMMSDVPAGLNAALLAGGLDCSPISSAFYAEHADAFVLLPDICIGSRSDVLSISCISQRPVAELRGTPIAVTSESATGTALLATLCRRWYGFAPQLMAHDDPFALYTRDSTPCLLIGDAAIEARFSVPEKNIHDLGRMWHECSGEGMVYAVWAVRRAFAAHQPQAVQMVLSALRESLRWSRQHHRTIIERAQAVHYRPTDFYERYYATLTFDFDEAARHGLRAFFEAAHACGVLGVAPALQFVREAQHV
ncbi:MAG: menaquinone biosynthesis protein [Candidatus Eremiobacteraeota bacterium]|nr:menaquinone biosynthesis protein [Candidatus Eremiobacteraeota bacterium]